MPVLYTSASLPIISRPSARPYCGARFITSHDTQASTHVAVVDQSFAAKFFPGESAIGHHFGLLPDHANDYEIVGVVKDTKYRNAGIRAERDVLSAVHANHCVRA